MGEVSPGATRRALALILPAALLVAGLAFIARDRASTTPAPDAAATQEATAPQTGTTDAAESAPAAAAPAEAPQAQASAPGAATPAFDLVRVEPDGSAVVAGTAEPGASVTVYADAAPLAEVEADERGNFVAIFRAEPSAKPQALTLGAVTPDGSVPSDEVVMLLPPAPPPGAATEADAASADEPGEPAASNPDTDAPADAPAAEPEAVAAQAEATGDGAGDAPAPPEPAAQVAATAILRADAVEVTPAEAGAPQQVTLGSISYTRAGQVTLAGLGTAGASVRAYVEDRFTRESRVGADGRWNMDLSDVAEGVYTLRIDQLGPDGKVASRVETPFQRDYPSPPPRPGVAGPAPTGEGAVSVTVQPGHNLWTLAREHYGSGVMYTQIFTANLELIRDPDLIYPGQIFNLPAMDAAD